MSVVLVVALLNLVLTLSLAAANGIANSDGKKRVAVVGGGVGGTFAARFLAEYDAPCLLSRVDVFDPSPHLTTGAVGGTSDPSNGNFSGTNWQGSRVSTLKLGDGATVELGASIIFGGNRLITEQVESDESLEKASPGSTGKEAASDPGGFGVYEGGGVWDLMVRDDEPDWKVALRLAWRYSFDLVKIRNAVRDAFASFEQIYELLDGPGVFTSPDDLWRAVGLFEATTMSFDEYLDTIGISGSKDKRKESGVGTKVEWSWWRAFLAEFLPAWDGIARMLLPGHGSLRRELLDAININNYNQDNSQLDGLAGLVSFIPTQGDIYCIRNGNGQILSSAFRRAKEIHAAKCGSYGIRENVRGAERGSDEVFHHVEASVVTIVFSDDGIEIWGNSSANSNGPVVDGNSVKLGVYDTVILAAPLQHCRIAFRTKSTGAHHPLKLHGLTKARAHMLSRDEPAPSSTTREYTQTVTTVVTNATLLHDSFGLAEDETAPRAISVTARGKDGEGFSALSRLSELDGTSGMFKIFSPGRLTREQLSHWFGSNYVVEYEKVWGGPHGGAYPDFAGGGEAVRSAPFLLHGDKNGDGPALFYVNAIEATVSAMEVSAIGAKAVAKLVAQRLGMTECPRRQ